MLAETALAPESAVTVPAKAEVDQFGRFEEILRAFPATGRFERCVNEYRGVSVGDSKNR